MPLIKREAQRLLNQAIEHWQQEVPKLDQCAKTEKICTTKRLI
jgi:hypothetical protein